MRTLCVPCALTIDATPRERASLTTLTHSENKLFKKVSLCALHRLAAPNAASSPALRMEAGLGDIHRCDVPSGAHGVMAASACHQGLRR